MTDKISKINWTEVNPYEESTFCSGIHKHVLIAYKWNDFHLEYIVVFSPTVYVVKEFPYEHRKPKVYLKKSHNPEEDVEIVKWAILNMGDN
jgi:hypothetical protein